MTEETRQQSNAIHITDYDRRTNAHILKLAQFKNKRASIFQRSATVDGCSRMICNVLASFRCIKTPQIVAEQSFRERKLIQCVRRFHFNKMPSTISTRGKLLKSNI